MLSDDHPDRIQIAFDDHRLVNNAGLILPATLGLHLGLPQLVDRHLDLGRAPGRANTGDKVMTLVASALAGGDCIDAADALRAGRHGQGAIHLGDLPVSVLKNVLSGRFNARDDFWVVQVPKKPSQLVFVPSMAISQEDRIAVFRCRGRWRRRRVRP